MMAGINFLLVAAVLLASSVVISANTCAIVGDVPNPSPKPDTVAPEKFSFSFDTNVVIDGKPAEPIVIEVIRAWAPLGADRLYSLIKDGFYNGAAFFRVVPDFVLQFGISASPDETAKWDTNIPDDPVVVSNTNWTVTYATAGPNTRTTQLFINYIDNSRLDADGFAPFGRVVSGFETALNVVNPTPDNSNGINQELYTKLGKLLLC
jgi:cyclophilin family peptidyl-prolyl cis-trans isomerase